MMQTGKIIQALQELSEDDLKKVAMEANRILAQKQTLTGSEYEHEAETADEEDTPFEGPPDALLSPEDEKNVRRIWKSPGGC